MKIRKYINAEDLPQFKDIIESLYQCDYCDQNYDEEGNKTDSDIYQDYIESALEYGEAGDKIQKESLLTFMKAREIEFVRF
jgi:hypothetical protein